MFVVVGETPDCQFLCYESYKGRLYEAARTHLLRCINQ